MFRVPTLALSKEDGLEVNCACVRARPVGKRRTCHIKIVCSMSWTVVKFKYLRMTRLMKPQCLQVGECLLSFGADCFVSQFAIQTHKIKIHKYISIVIPCNRPGYINY